MTRVDIWSDVVCPFCYIGKRHLEAAARDLGVDLDVVWHAYELDPRRPALPQGTLTQHLAKKYGMSEGEAEAAQQRIAATAGAVGIRFNWRDAKPGNTRDAHRVVKLAGEYGKADAAEEAFFKAYMTDGESIGSRDTVVKIATSIGLPEGEVRDMLESDRFVREVEHDQAFARDLGVQGVPFFVLDEKLALSGAQPIAAFKSALEQAQKERQAAQGASGRS